MTASSRRGAAHSVNPAPGISTHDLWQAAVALRQQWLADGLCTQPADRPTAERCLTALYVRLSRPRPRFVWVDSPRQALSVIHGWPTLDQIYQWIRTPRPGTAPPLASD